MAITVHNPTTPGRRKSSVIKYSDVLTKGAKPVKKLMTPRKKTGGRNNTGKITVRHRGGGNKQFIRHIDFKRTRYDDPAIVETIEYDPIRSAFISRIKYQSDGTNAYILAAAGMKEGDIVVTSQKRKEVTHGNRFPLSEIPSGSTIYNIEMTPGKGGQMVRSAGQGAQLMSVEGPYALIKMPSGEIRNIQKACFATIGTVSNPDNIHVRIGKAGRKRHMGIKPTVRGKAMNPVDHPHGGGEGNQSIGLKHPKTPWGKPALGVRTRKSKKKSSRFIIKRRKK
jgi:large subunit ribosomal protein L2